MVNIKLSNGKRIDSNVFTQVLDNTKYNQMYSRDIREDRNSIFYETFAHNEKEETYFKETIEIERRVEIDHTLVHGEKELSKILNSKFNEGTVSKILSFLEQSAKNMFSYTLEDYNSFTLKNNLEVDSSLFYKLGYFAPFYYMDENKVRANVLVLVGDILVHAVRITKDVYTVEANIIKFVKRNLFEISNSEYNSRRKLINLDVYSVRSEKIKYELPKKGKVNVKEKQEENKVKDTKTDNGVKASKKTKTTKVDSTEGTRKLTEKKKEAIA